MNKTNVRLNVAIFKGLLEIFPNATIIFTEDKKTKTIYLPKLIEELENPHPKKEEENE